MKRYQIDTTNMIKGNRLRDLRIQRGLTAEELSRELGIGLSQVFRYEAEKTDPSSDVLIKMALFFHVSVDYLVGLARDPDPYDPASHLEDWPPATLDEVLVLDYMGKKKYLDAIQVILDAYHEWKTELKKDEFDFGDLDEFDT